MFFLVPQPQQDDLLAYFVFKQFIVRVALINPSMFGVD